MMHITKNERKVTSNNPMHSAGEDSWEPLGQ